MRPKTMQYIERFPAMRVVTNEAQIKRNRQISQILFFVSLIGMGLGFFYTWTSDPNSQGNQLTCIILPILLLLTLTSVRMANTWVREPRPVDVLTEAFKGLGKRYTVFHYLLPAAHVLIGPEGVFTIKSIWQDKEYQIKGQIWLGEQGFFSKINGYFRQDLIGNPFQDALLEAQQVQKLIDKVAPDSGVEVQPLIVFINPKASFEAEDPLFPVLYADSKRKPSLQNYLRDQKSANRATLTDEELDKIDTMYRLVTRQEIAEMLGETWEETTDSVVEPDELDDEEIEEVEDASIGTVFLAKSGQLFYIGTATDSVEEKIAELQAESDQEVELLHSFETRDPDKTVASLHNKFARKRQKDKWFGLSKKDITGLMSR
jgi:hypothetical protein